MRKTLETPRLFVPITPREAQELDVVLDALQLPNLNAHKDALTFVLTAFQNEDNTPVLPLLYPNNTGTFQKLGFLSQH